MNDTQVQTLETMDIQGILDHLPHRFPFLLIDRITELVPGEHIVALKNVSYNEPFFVGHFPKYPVMPGVLIVEAMAQAAGVLSFRTTGDKPKDGHLYLFAGIDNVRFKAQVTPGDQMLIEVKIERRVRNIWKYKGVARVGGNVVAEADMMCAQVPTNAAPAAGASA
ncbi:3-hydroxyacyl-ACP dehydratase FabZ [Chitinimonas sp. BJB300]|uniref:3-hydroxyacyl-ACP dehydratase FabZ n=1 Tax=Chitinimonas sp. BJB300 TaxID=1559339 RepID=UPI0018ED80C9|nr:3-hydroxyacyl-ACP dehydratase FabZ [Chitinimonas sp. BJB300]